MVSLYKIHTSSNPSEKGKIVKADRNTLHRIVTAFKAGREVNMSEILKHELMPVPIAIAHIHVCIFTKCPQILVFQTLNKTLAIYN
jgi:hypothetical protein